MARPYPSYKPSGVEWLGYIPAHWSIGRLKFSATSRTSNVDKHTKDDELPVELCNYVDVYNNDFITSELTFMKASATAPEIERFVVRKGDVLITKDSESWDDIAVPAMVAEDLSGVLCGYHLAIIRSLPGAFHAGYLFRLFCSEMLNYQFKIEANGVTRFGLPTAAIDNALLLRPPLPEQELISQYIDRETARTDALIAKKRRLLDLLEEKRLTVITQAVTKGLDPDAPAKDSGIDWLGRIPAHWEAKRLRFVMETIEQGWSPLCNNYPAEDDEWGVLKVGCVNGTTFDQSENKALPSDLAPREHYEISSGDILMSRANTKELLGSAAIVQEVRPKLLLCDKLYRLVVSAPIDRQFAVLALRSHIARFQYERAATGTSGSMQNIGQDTIKDVVVALPPLEEQRAIVAHLNTESARTDRMMDANRRFIDVLQEYRSALITNAVTGKIDVRGEVEKEAAA